MSENGHAEVERSELRERIERKRGQRKWVTLEVPDWGVTVEIRSMTVGKKFRLLGEDSKPEEVENRTLAEFAEMMPQVVVATCFDPETGEPVFDASDVEWLAEEPAETLELVANAGLAASGMTKDSVAVGKGSSSSPATFAISTSEQSG